MRPELGDGRTRVLLAVTRQARPTVRSVATEAGRSISETHRHLEALRDDGLVSWLPDSRGTLRACVREVRGE